MPFSTLKRLLGITADPTATLARQLYDDVVAAARRPAFYADLSVPDTIDGRYELIVAHVIMVMRRLRREGDAAALISQKLQETMVMDFDQSIREFGIGDTGVAKRVKTMLRGFAGRIGAYEAALSVEDAADRARALDVVLDNNLYGTVTEVPAAHRAALGRYLMAVNATLAEQPLDALRGGRVRFPDIQGFHGE